MAQAVTVSLEDLEKGTVPFSTLKEAFGPTSLGILIVKDVPERFTELRSFVLSGASYLGNLGDAELAKLEHPPSKFLTGWSLGKEMLSEDQVDTHKGSFYANCSFYSRTANTVASASTSPANLKRDDGDKYTELTFPEYLSPNLFPPSSLLPGFQDGFEQLVTVILDVAVLVAAACDRYAEADIEGYEKGYLKRVVEGSKTSKVRLLHYYPSSEIDGIRGKDGEKKDEEEGDDDSWCTTHLDHGCLTGLTSAMFVDESLHPPVATTTGNTDRLPNLPELPRSPDPRAGLYIKGRDGKTTQVGIPRDCIAFQTGETLERITEGRFRAVPHFVRGVRNTGRDGGRKIARNTLAVFTQPNLGEIVDRRDGLTFGEFARGVVAKNTVV